MYNLTTGIPALSRLFHVLLVTKGIMEQIRSSDPESLHFSGRTRKSLDVMAQLGAHHCSCEALQGQEEC